MNNHGRPLVHLHVLEAKTTLSLFRTLTSNAFWLNIVFLHHKNEFMS